MSAPNECKPVRCPECLSIEVHWWEDVPAKRNVVGIGADGRVIVSPSDTFDWEGSKNERLECCECGHEWRHENGYHYVYGDEYQSQTETHDGEAQP